MNTKSTCICAVHWVTPGFKFPVSYLLTCWGFFPFRFSILLTLPLLLESDGFLSLKSGTGGFGWCPGSLENSIAPWDWNQWWFWGTELMKGKGWHSIHMHHTSPNSAMKLLASLWPAGAIPWRNLDRTTGNRPTTEPELIFSRPADSYCHIGWNLLN